MTNNVYRFLRNGAFVLTASAIAIGCTTPQGGGARQPHARAHSQLNTEKAEEAAAAPAEPTTPPKSATDLLREAEQEFQTANSAQERGDFEASLRHYNRMLELLVEADLDPGIFYSLRTEFEKILKKEPGGETQEARLFDEKQKDWAQTAMESLQIESELKTPESLAARVQLEVQEIQQNYPRNFQYGLNRSYKYVPYIQAEMKKAGLPPDLAWLAMVESQFTPKIVSRAGAGGMWQFMRDTGKRYGLRVDDYVDERYNWKKSTHAAISYLQDLGSMFGGEWPLAISAYNMGEGGMERAVAMNGGARELINLIEQPPASNLLRQETKKFYPKLLASIIVAKEPERYGFRLEPQAPDATVPIPVRGCYSLAALDSASGLPEGTLHKLNPDLIRGVTPPTGEYTISVPEEAKDSFVAALTNVPQERRPSIFSRHSRSKDRSDEQLEERSQKSSRKSSAKDSGSGTVHKVRPGETLAGIARKYGVKVEDLRAANDLRSSHRLYSGTRLTIPGKGAETESEADVPDESPAASQSEGRVETKSEPIAKEDKAPVEAPIYMVKRGDTLAEIAADKGVTVKQLKDWNGLKRPSDLQVGARLKVGPAQAAPSEPVKAAAEDTVNAADKQTYKVQPGDYPAKIAKQFGVTVDELSDWNKLGKNCTIQAGQSLTIYSQKPTLTAKAETPAVASEKASSGAAKAEAKFEESTYEVKPGETLGKIASKNGVSLDNLLAWNGLKSTSVLQPGQKLVLRSSNAKAEPATTETKPEAKKEESAKSKKAADAPAKTTYEVKKGDNPTTIAKKQGVKLSDLYKWNGWSKDPVLKLGDKIVIEK